MASELLLGGSIFPDAKPLSRDAVGVPDDWMLAGHIVIGWPKGRHGPVWRRPLSEVVNCDYWDDLAAQRTVN